MLPGAAFGGFTEFIAHVTVWLEALITVVVNCCCWPVLRFTVCGFTLTISGPVPKNTPLTTALLPAVRVILIFTCPEIFQAKYSPLWKLEILRVSNTVLVFASNICMGSARAVLSQ